MYSKYLIDIICSFFKNIVTLNAQGLCIKAFYTSIIISVKNFLQCIPHQQNLKNFQISIFIFKWDENF